jgi:hypothetical protein
MVRECHTFETPCLTRCTARGATAQPARQPARIICVHDFALLTAAFAATATLAFARPSGV